MKTLKRTTSRFFLLLVYLRAIYLFKHRNQVTIIGRENLPIGIGNLFVSKHLSSLDPFVLFATLFSWRDILFCYDCIPYNTPRNKHVDGKLIRRLLFYFLKTVIIIRNSSDASTRQKQVLAMAEPLKTSNVLTFFEGTRQLDIGPCKRGVAQVIQLAKPKQVIPIFIKGTEKLLPPGITFSLTRVAAHQELTVVIGKNIIFSDLTNLEKIRQEIKTAVSDLAKKI